MLLDIIKSKAHGHQVAYFIFAPLVLAIATGLMSLRTHPRVPDLRTNSRERLHYVRPCCQTPLRTDPETPLKLTPPIRSAVGLRRAEKLGPFLLS